VYAGAGSSVGMLTVSDIVKDVTENDPWCSGDKTSQPLDHENLS
jgi:hypothetical protein